MHDYLDLETQAFKDLAKGEKTASAMETQLTQLEKKIDDLLASVDDAGQQSAGPAAKGVNGDAAGSGSAPGPGIGAKDGGA
ncbi:MAG: hypothetical protein FRX48_01012 [Lasallia pustulata]|uniref:Uncharacterized protein n=1 Tax=Lasallia pustulata TaxID=136370 RepID=A0A5M8Q3N3_9LECA|nr:MAG: hypothetical protein FRX48_01012 [Lasallia pustulata]